MIIRIALITAFFTATFTVKSQDIKVLKYPDLERLINERSEKIRVFNFWATWCGPCVKELPHFESLNKNYNTKTEVLLISFDFVEDIDRLKAFVKKKSIKSKVYLLDETDYNSFIDKIDPNWSGAIPATLLVDNRTRKKAFFEKSFEGEELKKTYLKFQN